ncbi:helix-turn-helix transcriptional regulator [Jannaschia sp. R86511]|uniref:helix-turn-helix transcriptional regulator n=1 Tax=Jannaschia sp. R86511 TaxID=3093853 RepID=UPI0036D3C862
MENNADGERQPALWEGADIRRDRTHAGIRPSRVAAAPVRPGASTPKDVGDLWTINEVASYLGVPKQTVYCWRTTGYGPHGFRVGKHLRWRAATVIAWTVEMERQQ